MNNRTRSDSISLSLLIKEINGIIEHVFGDLEKEIVSVEYNSKDAVKNCLFVAVSGFVSDGHDYVRDAVDRGAVAVVISKEWMSEFDDLKDHGITLLSSRNTRRALSYISASFFRYPTSKVPVIGVTGTNGKTSVTYMLESILKKYGLSPGVIGTVNYRWENNILNASNTTPESRDLQEIFSYMIRDGVDVIVMEVSSHALKLFRVDDIEFDAVIFTNLTRDHLDFHDTFDEYFNSKRKIFQILERSGKKNKCAVVNIDDDYGRLIFNKDKGFSYLMKSFGVANNADYKVEKDSIQNSINGVSYQLKESQGETKIELKLSGGFQVYNSLSAFAACHMMGVPVDVIYKGLSGLQSIPGRFDRISSKSGFNVIVDYAHTDDALSKLLLSAKELNPERIITIFGCGGNRDRTKRPLMGITAVEGSDWVIITSDNPRDEDPNEIIKDIVHGINLTNYEIEPDREKAIEKAVSIAEDGDLVVIAGKGHEDYQLIGGRRIHFDDAEIIKKYISRREHS